MLTHRSKPSLSLLVMYVVMQALVTCTYSQDCSIYSQPFVKLQCSICVQIKQSVTDANRNIHLLADRGTWSQVPQSQKDGICNLLALRDVAERAQGTAAAISSSLELLEQNVQDACKLVSIPDGDCKDVLRYNCFWSMTRNNALNGICSDYDFE